METINNTPMMNDLSKYCLATVITENYFQWAMTMLYSFKNSNPWFSGDIVVICKDLPDQMISDLLLFEHVKIIEPSQVLLNQIDLLADEVPKFKDISARFFSLESFRLENYQIVHFLDSEMIVVKSIEEIFRLPDLFYASAQLCFYKGKGRNSSTFVAEIKSEDSLDILENTVNTGFMLLDEELYKQNHYLSLIELITPETWSRNNFTYTDELIINQYFNGRISLLHTRYNYRARAARIIREKEDLAFEDAKIIHFYSKFKPWNFTEVLASSAKNLNWIKAYGLWYNWYIEFLKFYHFQKKIVAVTNNKTKS
jgi:lipopolysaccharide biosynthesis glycosyltransferase